MDRKSPLLPRAPSHPSLFRAGEPDSSTNSQFRSELIKWHVLKGKNGLGERALPLIARINPHVRVRDTDSPVKSNADFGADTGSEKKCKG